MGSKELWMYNCEFTWWDDSDYYGNKKQVKCVVAGYDLVDVVHKLTSYYGDDQIESLSIEIIDNTDSGIMEVSKEQKFEFLFFFYYNIYVR